MSRRNFIVLASAAFLMLLTACGGGSSSSSPTPTAEVTPTPSPAPVACTASNLYGAVVTSETVNNAQFLTIGISNTTARCFLSGPPTVNWYDNAGAKLVVPAPTSVRCQPQAGDYTTCVFDDQVVLEAGAATPAADVNGQAVAVVVVKANDSLPQCPPPTETAHFIGLEFPGVTPDMQVELSGDVSLQTCTTQVTLQGYGPLATGE